MARLNEPPAESVESLKRRFVRQNRELARNNSTQSVKIRNLETQVSQLVAENVALRANIIQLQSERDDRKHVDLAGSVDVVRKKLEDKLTEFQGLVAELGACKRGARSHGEKPSPKHSPAAQRFWSEHRVGVTDIFGNREGSLPTIAEGKQYPRRTLEARELQALISNQSSDSPDIGPPPRTSVDSPDRSDPSAPSTLDNPTDDNTLSGLFSVNLETRRKRRETTVLRDTTSSSNQPPSRSTEQDKPPDLWTAQPVRAGSKRKLDTAYRPTSDENSLVKGKDELALRNSVAASDSQNLSPARRVLAPKSVNTDPVVSPKKSAPQDKNFDPPPTERINPKARDRRRSSQHNLQQLESEDDSQGRRVSDVLCKIEPKTPAPLDLFSPGSTEHSDVRPEGRGDTPPPSGLPLRSAATTHSEEAGAGRGSRRARAGVNYAEPNLISKMRRPTKDLVDAVAYNKNRSSTTPASEVKVKQEDQSDVQQDSQTAGFIKRDLPRHTAVTELDQPSNTNSEPQSPLVSKEDSRSEVASLDTLPNRRPDNNLVHQRNDSNGDSDDKAGLPNARLKPVGLKEASRREDKDVPARSSVPSATPGNEELDIFEVGPSPPRRPFTVTKSKPGASDAGKRGISAASGSARSVSGPNLASKPRTASSGLSSMPSSAPSSSTALNRPRNRRQTLGAGAGAGAGTAVGTDHDGKSALSNQGSGEGLRAARSTAALGTVGRADTEQDQARESKMATRRRSMMV